MFVCLYIGVEEGYLQGAIYLEYTFFGETFRNQGARTGVAPMPNTSHFIGHGRRVPSLAGTRFPGTTWFQGKRAPAREGTLRP